MLAVLGPYNFPAHLPNGHIVPALIAGNAIVFKPSEKTPAVGEMLTRLYHEAGVPEDVAICVQGGPETGKALAGHSGLDGLLFTGSARAGLALHQFAETPHKILALEMGGNNPLVVWQAKDIHAAAAIAVQSAYMSAGQRCTAARRLIVEDGKHEELVETIVKLIDRLIVDHPHASPAPFMGPVIDNAAADSLQEAYLDLLARRARDRRLDRKNDRLPVLTPSLIDTTAVASAPSDCSARPPLIRVPDFDAALAEAMPPLRPRREPGRRRPALYDRSGEHPRRRRQLEQADQRRPLDRPVRRHRPLRQHRPSAYYAAIIAPIP